HVGMGEMRERAALLDEALHAGIEAAPLGFGEMRLRRAVRPESERGGQVLLDRHRGIVLVVREIDEGEPAGGQDTEDAIVLEPAADLQWQVQLHDRYHSE